MLKRPWLPCAGAVLTTLLLAYFLTRTTEPFQARPRATPQWEVFSERLRNETSALEGKASSLACP